MKRLLLVILLIAAKFSTAQQNLVDTKKLNVRDSIFFDGKWHKHWLTNDGLLRGGIVAWESGLTFSVTPAIYIINDKERSSNAATITLNAAHSTLPRFDVIAVDTGGHVIKITGTANANPQVPQCEPQVQLYLTTILVNAGSTVPGGVSNTVIYNENIEWTGTGEGPVNMNNTVNPYIGSKAIDVSSTGIKFIFQNSGLLNLSDYSLLKMYVRLKLPYLSEGQGDYYVALFNSTTGATSPYLEVKPTHGFNKFLAGSYQTISIPVTEIMLTGTKFDGFIMKITGDAAATRGACYVDNIHLQSGMANLSTAGIQGIYKRSDSIFVRSNGFDFYAFKDSTGVGGWNLTGNSSINSSTNFIGSTNLANLVFKVNNHKSGLIDVINSNTGFGYATLSSGSFSGSNNCTFGYGAMTNTLSGNSNSAFGERALNGNTTGSNNAGFGNSAGKYNTTASNQIFINSIDRTNYTGDQTGSPIYIQQNATVASQVITLNAGVIKKNNTDTIATQAYARSVASGGGGSGPAWTDTTTKLATKTDIRNAKPYKVYSCWLNGGGGGTPPTATVLENTTGGTIAWTWVSDNVYLATITGATFTAGKTVFPNGPMLNEVSEGVKPFPDARIFPVNTTTFSLVTDFFGDMFIEVRIYY